MTSTEVFTIESKEHGVRALEALGARFPSRLHPEETARRVLLDTFDWRVRRSGRTLSLLEARGDRWLVLEEEGGAVPRRQRVEREPAFADELPPGPLRDRLAELVGARRLLSRVALQEERRVLDVLDEEEKTVCRAVLEGGACWRPEDPARNGRANGSGVLPPRLCLVGLRGYEAGLRRVELACREELRLAPAQARGLDLALAACGLSPATDARGPLLVHPQEPCEAVVRRILAACLDGIEANEDGVRRDLDREFLHDFRIALRRSRSILSLLREALPRSVEPFADELRWLGEITGPLRDQDVFLEELAPRRELAELCAFVRERRVDEHARLAAELGSERFRRFVAGWRACLSDPGLLPTEVGLRPVREVVSATLRELFDGLLERGRKIERKTSARKVHRVRIRAKKLRYLLDAFRSLYEGEDYAFVLRELRKLQDVLGAYNDLVVQQAALRRVAGEMEACERGSAELFVTVGALIERRKKRARRLRRSVARRFARFDRREERERFEVLVAPPP